MPRLSRWMPASPKRTLGPRGLFLLGIAVAGLLTVLAFSAGGRFAIGAVLLAMLIFHTLDQRRLRRLARGRPGENICTFARSFDRRATDLWVVRAIYEELRPFCRFRGGQLPVRPSDALFEDLRIDSEDVVEIVQAAALRTGRVIENLRANPFYDRLATVADLIALVQLQPKVSRPAA